MCSKFSYHIVNNSLYGKETKFSELIFPENEDVSFLTDEHKQILMDVRQYAKTMPRKNLEDWIVLPYFELIKLKMNKE